MRTLSELGAGDVCSLLVLRLLSFVEKVLSLIYFIKIGDHILVLQ